MTTHWLSNSNEIVWREPDDTGSYDFPGHSVTIYDHGATVGLKFTFKHFRLNNWCFI